MKKTGVVIAVVLLVTLAVILQIVVGDPVIAFHNHQLKEAVCALVEGQISLGEAIPFRWDAAYTFPPYTGREEIEQTIGAQSGRIEESTDEGMVQLVLTDRGRVTAAVCGYPEKLGYSIAFEGKLTPQDDAVFTVEKSGGTVLLKQAK